MALDHSPTLNTNHTEAYIHYECQRKLILMFMWKENTLKFKKERWDYAGGENMT